MSVPDPHVGQPVLRRGPPLAEARIVVVMVHGRGDSAAGILGLAEELRLVDVAYLAPQAADHTWYPYSFLAPEEENEPGLSSGLRVIEKLIDAIGQEGVVPDRVGILGFSQGACLSLEFVARHTRRYTAVVGLSGGLIGPENTRRDYEGSLSGTPVFLGCSDVDSHVPVERVRETTEILRALGGSVEERIYRGMGHTINQDEIEVVRSLLQEPKRDG